MLVKIRRLLKNESGLKAKEIASRLGFDRQDVSRELHANKTVFLQNEAYGWALAPVVNLRVELGPGWIDATQFETRLLVSGCPTALNCVSVSFVFAEASQLLLDALARLLALCNQFCMAGKGVVLDFSGCKKTLGYLDRVGFVELLDRRVSMLPRRPSGARAIVYEGNNENVVELKTIEVAAPNQTIPSQLRSSFVTCAGDAYSEAAFTVISELFGNVQEHSGSITAGFAGLQHYKKGNKIQTVISDSGLGIIGTLEPVLNLLYPQIAEELAAETGHKGVALLSKVFSVGGLSKVDEEGRGLGLIRSGQLAQKYNATISIRQRDFELSVHHRQGKVAFSNQLNLVRLEGTHICFTFDLTKSPKSG